MKTEFTNEELDALYMALSIGGLPLYDMDPDYLMDKILSMKKENKQ